MCDCAAGRLEIPDGWQRRLSSGARRRYHDTRCGRKEHRDVEG